MASNTIENVMALFNLLEIDWSDTELGNEATKKPNPSSLALASFSYSNELGGIEYQRIKTHRERKRSLGYRLVVLRSYIKRCFEDKWVNDSTHWNELEDWLDYALKEHDYDLEKAIDYYRRIAPEPLIIDGRCKCGYMPPFCACVSSKD